MTAEKIDKETKIFIQGLSSFKNRTKMTQDALASIMGVNRTDVSKILSGERGVKISNVSRLLDNGMTLSEVFGDDLTKKLLTVTEIPSSEVLGQKFSKEQLRQALLELLND